EALALHRVEGDLAVIPSTASIDAGLPPGTFSARTHLVPAPNISTQLWLGTKEPLDEVLGPFDARIRLAATLQYLIQVAGLDVLLRVVYEDWSYQTWLSAGIDDRAGAHRRSLDLSNAVTVRLLRSRSGRRREAYAGMVADPLRLGEIGIGDGVQ